MIGKNIRKYRERKEFSQEFVASKLGLSQKAYSNIELDVTDLNINRLMAIANVLEVTPEKLIEFDANRLGRSGLSPVSKAPKEAELKSIVELYEKIIKVLEEKNRLLEIMIEQLNVAVNQKSTN